MDIKTVGVVGGRVRGSGIAHVFALAGLDVTLVETKKPFLDKAMASITKNLDRQAAKGGITPAQKEQALSHLHPTLDFNALSKAELVVEAVPEDLELKKEIFRRLDNACAHGTILASNTSSLSITALAGATMRPDKVIGMHFMNPVPVMKLVEIIRGKLTSEDTYKLVESLTVGIGKTPALSDDKPGFIANRVLMPMINEAAFALMEGVATKEDIDTVMKLGLNHPMGPLALADLIGLDVCLAIMEILHKGFNNDKYLPCPLIETLVAEGKLGRKTGEGFYEYSKS
jgi:3-hydroxybutyryl-CoA dehydrogenase